MLDWIAQLLGLPDGLARPHRGHGVDVDDRGPCGSARRPAGRARRRLLPESALVRRQGGAAARPRGAQGRRPTTSSACGRSARPATRCGCRGHGRHDVDDFGRPGRQIAARAREAGVWLHVDAAYAGSAWVCPELRWSPRGRARRLARGQSAQMAVRAGRLLVLWTSRPGRSARGFSLVPEYLRTDEVDNLSEYGPALGRRFRSLKLWAVLRCYGREGLQARIREAIRLADLFESWVAARPAGSIEAPRHLSVVCFRRDGTDADNEALLDRVNASGEVFMSATRLRGRTCSASQWATPAPPRRTCVAPGPSCAGRRRPEAAAQVRAAAARRDRRSDRAGSVAAPTRRRDGCGGRAGRRRG